MTTYTVDLAWQRGEAPFVDGKYGRRHTWRFDGGVTVPASASPHVVRVPYSDPGAVDPEEAFVAALASCHLLWFLSIAAQRGYCVDSYADAAEGIMARNARGKLAMTRVTLRPRVAFAGAHVPDADEFAAMHHEAHDECFIANSVTTEVACEPVCVAAAG